jgi:hypothetical protein
MTLALSLSLTAGAALAQDAAKPADTMAKPANPVVKPADAAAAPAAPPPAAPAPVIKRVKMRTLMSQGYDIKAVSFVPQDASSRVSKTLDKDAALITLQKGSAAATCFITLEEYVSPGMTDIEWCIEQK